MTDHPSGKIEEALSHGADEHAPHGDAAHDHSDHGGLGKYVAVFVALCCLTFASFFTYTSYWPFHEQKEVTWAFMMAVSCTKAMLVVLFFMHLLWEANWKWVLTVPATCMSIFLVLMLVPDVGWRQNTGFATYSYERKIYAADPPPHATPAKHDADHTDDHDADHADDHNSDQQPHTH